MTVPQGLLLFAHGARDPLWARPFEAVAERCRAAQQPIVHGQSAGQGQMVVALAFLEFMAPDLLTAGDQLVAQGCRHVRVVPLFLGAGGHVRKDLPVLMATLGQRHPGVVFQLDAAVGEASEVVAAMARVALAGTGTTDQRRPEGAA